MCVVMCESVRLGGWIGVVMAWFCRLEAVGLSPISSARPERLRGDILVVCRTTAESGPGAGRVREGGEVISRVGLALPSRVSCHAQHKWWIRIGISLLLCLLCLSVCSACLLQTVQLHNKPAVTPRAGNINKNRKPLG